VDLSAELPRLLPKAVAWVEAESARFLEAGRPLHPSERAIARAAGVRYPERVRVAAVDAIPRPDDVALREAALQVGLLGPDTVGLALGHAVLLRSDFVADPGILGHELRHVRQYECYGSIKAFLSVYLPQLVQFGYRHAPLEIEARSEAAPDPLDCGDLSGSAS